MPLKKLPEKARRMIRRGLCFAALAGPLLWFALCLPDPLFEAPYSPVLYDREGRLLGALAAADGQWRFPPGPVNEKFAAAVIEAEDRRFRRHPGVDPLALFRALGQNIRARRVVSGASTITMQTVRIMRRQRRTLPEKALEGIMALRLDLTRSKDEILSLYAANAPFGANVVGLEAAAWRWFGRGAAELSWAEAAALAVLPNSPGLIHPGRNRELLRQKRDALLEKLSRRAYLDEEDLYLAKMEELPGEPLPLPRLAPHLLSRIVEEQGGLASFNGGKNRRGATAKNGGSSGILFSTLDRTIQERAALILNRASERFRGNGVMNGACLILDTRTGQTAAYVGNTDTAEAGDVDVITSSRSSGSLLKPFLFAAMLDSGDILPSALVSDIPTRVGSYSPENITRTYLGVVPAGEALARSLNIPAVRSLRRFGVDRFARFLRSLGISTLFRPGDEYGLPLILGGAEVTLWDMAALYAGLARSAMDGQDRPAGAAFFPARYFPLAADSAPAAESAATFGGISPGAAWLTLEALTFTARPGEEARWQEYAGSRRIAWKTGTSFGNRDAWAIGLTADWTVAVWIGNATGEGRAELRSANTAAPVLFELFSALDSLGISYGEGNRFSWFPQPAAALKYQDVCAYSGFPPGPDCAVLSQSPAPAAAPPHRPCPYCMQIAVNAAGRRVFLAGAAGETVQQESRFVLPPAEEWYYRRWNLDYRPLPAADSESAPPGSPAAGEAALALFNPQPGAQIYVPRELDGAEGRIVFAAAHRNPGGRIYWHLDGAYLGSTSVFHEMEARPAAGPHTLTLVDEQGNTLSRRFEALGTTEP